MKTTLPRDPLLDLDPWIGQRACTFKFYVTDAATSRRIGQIHPIRDASLTHDTGRTIKRTLNLNLGTSDTAAINPISDRIEVEMVFREGQTYPLGKYMFTSPTTTLFTSGRLSSQVLNDEMFIVDQPILQGVGTGTNSITELIRKTLEGLDIRFEIEASEFITTQAWSIGSFRGSILEDLALTGDYFSPWFDNNGIFKMIRSFDPAKKIPSLDLDDGHRVLRSGITETSDLITAPNTFMIISNSTNTSSVNNQTAPPVVAVAEVPASAPNSVRNRGFKIIHTEEMTVDSSGQAVAAARGFAQRNTIFERVSLTTPPDPRHDSYNVIQWNGDLWLELSWSMALVEGGNMNHLLRKAYRS